VHRVPKRTEYAGTTAAHRVTDVREGRLQAQAVAPASAQDVAVLHYLLQRSVRWRRPAARELRCLAPTRAVAAVYFQPALRAVVKERLIAAPVHRQRGRATVRQAVVDAVPEQQQQQH
jgi:hypothetical protein